MRRQCPLSYTVVLLSQLNLKGSLYAPEGTSTITDQRQDEATIALYAFHLLLSNPKSDLAILRFLYTFLTVFKLSSP